MNEIAEVISNEGVTKNPLGAVTSLANKKMETIKDHISGLTTEKAEKLLSKAGVNKSTIRKAEDTLAKARGFTEKARNYGLESVNDLTGKVADYQQFVSNHGLENCDLAGKLFGFAGGVGKELMKSIGLEISNLNDVMSRLSDWVNVGLATVENAEDYIERMITVFQDIDRVISEISDKIMELGNQMLHAIEDELNEYANVVANNAKHAAIRLLGGLLDDPCISGAVSSVMTDGAKRLAKKAVQGKSKL